MRVVIVWKDYTDYSREVIDWLREFNRRTGKELESIDPDTKDGGGFAKAYDVVEYPTVLALMDDGKLMSMWRGLPLPTINEVSFYTKDN